MLSGDIVNATLGGNRLRYILFCKNFCKKLLKFDNSVKILLITCGLYLSVGYICNTFDIYFCTFFDCYCQSLISGRETGH